MVLYDLNKLNAILTQPKLIYATDDYGFGVDLFPVKKALQKEYIQANNQKAINILAFDLDHDNPLIYEEVHLPAPNFIIRNRETNRSHYVYILQNFITKDYERFGKNLNFFALIQYEYTKKLKADFCFTNFLIKNPNHPKWATTNVNPYRAYTLDDLAAYLELPEENEKKPIKIRKERAIGEGRNCYLFDEVRQIAYLETRFYKNLGATFEDFENVVFNKLEKLNFFGNGIEPLKYNELKNIAKSITKFCWKNFNNSNFCKLQSNRGKKSAKSRQEKANKRLNEYEF